MPMQVVRSRISVLGDYGELATWEASLDTPEASASPEDKVLHVADLDEDKRLDRQTYQTLVAQEINFMVFEEGHLVAWRLTTPHSSMEGYNASGPTPKELDEIKVFLAGQGPDAIRLAQHLPTSYDSVYVAFGAPDEAFARCLSARLKEVGVRTFFYPDDAVGGTKNYKTMIDGVNEYDKIVLVCSRRAFRQRGLMNELDKLLAREGREGGTSLLIPVRLDGYILEPDQWPTGEAGTTLREIKDRNVIDFEGAQADTTRFEHAMVDLLGALRRPI